MKISYFCKKGKILFSLFFILKKHQKISLITILLLSITLFTSCRNDTSQEKTDFYLEYRDSYNRKVTLDSEPQRIISLSPAITEMIFLLHSEEKLVGISDFCNYPPETAKIKKVGGLIDLNIEHLISLNPDLILIGSIVGKNQIEKIEKLEIPVIALKEENQIEGIFRSLTALGNILNCPALAKEQIQILQQKLNKIEQTNKNDSTEKSVFYVVGFGEAGDFTAPKSSHIHEIITLAGGRNIGASLTGWSISRELIFEQNPDLIFIRKEDFANFSKTYPYNQLSAVKAGHLYPIESGWIDIVSPRNINAIEFMHRCIEEN